MTTDKSEKDMNTYAGCFLFATLAVAVATAIAVGIFFGAGPAWIVVAVYAAIWALLLMCAFIKAARKQKDSDDGDRS